MVTRMKPKAILKIGIDIAMTVLFLVQMGYHMLDTRVHEYTGIALCVLFILHHVLNGGWHKGLFKGKYAASRILLTVIDVLLTLTMAAVIVSAILVSRHAFSFLGLHLRSLGRQVHMPATMWAFVLTGLHLGLHWSLFLGMVKRAYKGKASKTAVALLRVALLAVFAFGAYEFVRRGLWMELFRLREFAFLEYGESLVAFVSAYVAILAMWAAVTHYLSKVLKTLTSKHRNPQLQRSEAQ